MKAKQSDPNENNPRHLVFEYMERSDSYKKFFPIYSTLLKRRFMEKLGKMVNKNPIPKNVDSIQYVFREHPDNVFTNRFVGVLKPPKYATDSLYSREYYPDYHTAFVYDGVDVYLSFDGSKETPTHVNLVFCNYSEEVSRYYHARVYFDNLMAGTIL